MYYYRFRYVLLCITFLCLTSIASNYMIINFTFICMKEDKKIDTGNGTFVSAYNYSQDEQTNIHWALAIGTVVGTGPVNYAYIKYGARWHFFAAGVISILSTLLLPTAASLGLWYLLVIRVFQGVAYSADFAAIGILCVRWTPLQQTGTFISVLTSFTPLAAVIVNPVCGMICSSSLGWQWAYYIHVAFGVLVFSLWIIFYQDDPQLHRNVSKRELEEIQKGKTKQHIERDSFVPYWDIIRNKVVLTVWANAFAEIVTITVLLTYSAPYFNNILEYDMKTTGLLGGLAASVTLPLGFVSGVYSDYMTCLPERAKMCFYNSFAVGLAGFFCFLIAFVPISPPFLFLFGAVFTAMGMNPGGFYKCGTLVSRQYAHFVMSTIQFMKCVALFVSPGLNWMFVKNEGDKSGWNTIFIINGALMLIANFMFYFVATDKPAAFTSITRESREKERKQRVSI